MDNRVIKVKGDLWADIMRLSNALGNVLKYYEIAAFRKFGMLILMS